LGIAFRGPKPFHNLFAVAAREVQVEKDQIEARLLRVDINAIDESDRLSAVVNDMQNAIDPMLLQSLSNERHVRRIIFGDQDNEVRCFRAHS